MKKKRKLYKVFYDRMSAAAKKGYHLEASWYAYAVIEDRLTSLLKSSGGICSRGSRRPIRMIGPKLQELSERARNDALLESCLSKDIVDAWKEKRNNLMHAMADGSLSIEEIDAESIAVATDGLQVAKKISANAMRFKKNRKKGR